MIYVFHARMPLLLFVYPCLSNWSSIFQAHTSPIPLDTLSICSTVIIHVFFLLAFDPCLVVLFYLCVYCQYLCVLTHSNVWNSFFFILYCVDLEFEFNENNSDAKAMVDKIRKPPVGDRLWPNCLSRPIRNASRVNIDDFVAKSGKLLGKSEDGTSEKPMHRPTTSMTRNK